MDKIDILKRRLYYQSHHRGTKEMDLLLGGFAERFLNTMYYEELLQFEELLSFSDQELYRWLCEEGERPKGISLKLIELIECCIK